MKFIVGILAVLVPSSLGCSLIRKPDPVPVVAPDLSYTDGVIALFGKFSIGHACPVMAPTPTGYFVLTAAHVANPSVEQPMRTDTQTGFAWSDGYGDHGFLVSLGEDPGRDLAALAVPPTLEIPGSTPRPYEVTDVEPQEGDEVSWVEYSFDNLRGALSTRVVTAHVLRVVAGHIILDRDPFKGSSGSCLFGPGPDHPVIGIVVWGMRMEDNQSAGVAVCLSCAGARTWEGGK